MVPEKDPLQEEAVYFEVFTTNLILFTFIVSSTFVYALTKTRNRMREKRTSIGHNDSITSEDSWLTSVTMNRN
jgi:heme/copper-type cytochrome/quinol oxidase subunit 2